MTTKKAAKKTKAKTAIDEVFGKAVKDKTVQKKDVVKKPKAKPKKIRKTHNFDKPFDTFIALTLMKNVIEEERSKLARKFKGAAFEIFMDQMATTGEKPESFTAKGDEGTALYSLKLRSAISDELAEKLEKLNIPYTTHEIAADGLMLNPDIMWDQELLEKMAKALKNVKELEPYFSTIFLSQEPTYSYALTAETISHVLENVTNTKQRTALIKALTSLAMSQPKLNGGTEESEEVVQRALQLLSEKGVFSLSIGKKKAD